MNNIHPSIQFTMEVDQNWRLIFLDVLVYKKAGGVLGHTVYRKRTHTDRYLHKNSNHHLGQEEDIIQTLTERARCICEPEKLSEEQALINNGYAGAEIISESSLCLLILCTTGYG